MSSHACRLTSRGLILATAMLLAAGCDDDSTEPRTATTLTIVSGDQQTTTVGVALANPLVVRVNDQNGSGLSGVSVAWAIASGTGTLSATSSTTDTNGETQVTYTPGTDAGAVSITATVSGLTAVTFTATVTAQ